MFLNGYSEKIWDAICKGIGVCLLNIDLPFSETVEWDGVFEESKNQRITSLVYEGLHTAIPRELGKKWKLYNLQLIAQCAQIIHETQSLNDLLERNEIRYCILKGTAASVYYPKPMLRSMGDIDFFVAPEMFEDTKRILTSNGYVISKEDEDNPRHLILFKNGIRFELHHVFGDKLFDKRILGNGLDKVIVTQVEGAHFSRLSDLENGMILLEHFRQELHEAVGIRHLLDWMMYVQEVVDDTYWRESFQKMAREFGIETLAITLTHVCQMYFGLSTAFTWCENADEKLCVRLMENLIQAGNFGINLDEGKSVEKTIINFRKEGLFHFLQKAGEYNWKAYHKYACLKPFAWMYQIGRYARQGIQAGLRRNGKGIRNDMSRSSARYKLLKDLNAL